MRRGESITRRRHFRLVDILNDLLGSEVVQHVDGIGLLDAITIGMCPHDLNCVGSVMLTTHLVEVLLLFIVLASRRVLLTELEIILLLLVIISYDN